MEFFGFEVPHTLEGGSILEAFRNTNASTRSEIYMEWGATRWITTVSVDISRSDASAAENTSFGFT